MISTFMTMFAYHTWKYLDADMYVIILDMYVIILMRHAMDLEYFTSWRLS